MTAIVTNAKNRIAYNIIKSLSKKGIKVHTCDFIPLSMSFASRYSKSHFLYPSPFRDQKSFIDSIINNINRLKSDVLIPVFEETFLIAKFKNKLLEHTKMVIPDYNQILIVHNKDRWLTLASRLNIPSPRTYFIEEIRNMNVKIKEIGFPILIKPKQGGGGWAITQINSPEKLEDLLNHKTYINLPWDRFFFQEKIFGEIQCVAMLFREGEYRAKITYKQLRDYPVRAGQASLRISIQNEKAEYYFQKLLEDLRWHGVCQADFVIDRKTGIPYLIDINPRFWGSLAQGIASGVDFPYLLYKIAVDGDVKPRYEFKKNVITRWIGGDISGFFSYLMQSNDKAKFIANFFHNNNKVTYDDFDLKDPLPFFIWSMDEIFKLIKRRTLKLKSHDSLDGIWE